MECCNYGIIISLCKIKKTLVSHVSFGESINEKHYFENDWIWRKRSNELGRIILAIGFYGLIKFWGY